MDPKHANAAGVLVPQKLAQRLRNLCDQRGLARAAMDVGISRATAARVLGGESVRKGSVALLAAHFGVRVQLGRAAC